MKYISKNGIDELIIMMKLNNLYINIYTGKELNNVLLLYTDDTANLLIDFLKSCDIYYKEIYLLDNSEVSFDFYWFDYDYLPQKHEQPFMIALPFFDCSKFNYKISNIKKKIICNNFL